MQRILIDTDPGVDDALAILLAMLSPELHIEAITTVCGNVPVTQATQNLLTILGILNPDEFPLIAQGEAQPLVKPLVTAAHVHGDDGLGNVSQLRNADGSPLYPPAHTNISSTPGVDLILEMVTRYPDELTLVALGPLTNIAKAIRKDAAKMQRLQKILVMGGAFEVYGNVTTTAEFNIFVDPHAAQEVFHANIPINIAPLDATHQVVLTGERLHAETNNDQTEFPNSLRMPHKPAWNFTDNTLDSGDFISTTHSRLVCSHTQSILKALRRTCKSKPKAL